MVFLASLAELVRPLIEEWVGSGIAFDVAEIPVLREIVELSSSDWLIHSDEAVLEAGSFPIQSEDAHEVAHLFLLAGITITIGVAGESFFKKTGVPDVIFLLILGMIVGPVLGIIDYEMIAGVIPYFAALALIIIMFDGGIHLNLKRIVSVGHYSLILAFGGFIITVVTVAVLGHYVIGLKWVTGILLGSMVGGSSSAIVFGLVRNIKISSNASNMLAFESAITDILATIVSFVFFSIIIAGFYLGIMASAIASSFGIGLLLGAVVGIPWMIAMSWIKRTQHAYMLTFGALFVLYYFATHIGETGAVTALIFGIIIGNRKYITRIFRIPIADIEPDNAFHNQFVFLVRVFFFVLIGLLASFGSIEIMIFSILCAIAIYWGRIPLAKLVLRNRFPEKERKIINIMIPRGLAAAVLATLPLTLGLPNSEVYPQAAFFIILATIIITSIGLTSHRPLPPRQDGEEDGPRRRRARRLYEAVKDAGRAPGRYRASRVQGSGTRFEVHAVGRWLKGRYDNIKGG